jgi:hypothetical protein
MNSGFWPDFSRQNRRNGSGIILEVQPESVSAIMAEKDAKNVLALLDGFGHIFALRPRYPQPFLVKVYNGVIRRA